jgi:hypothetical protein
MIRSHFDFSDAGHFPHRNLWRIPAHTSGPIDRPICSPHWQHRLHDPCRRVCEPCPTPRYDEYIASTDCCRPRCEQPTYGETLRAMNHAWRFSADHAEAFERFAAWVRANDANACGIDECGSNNPCEPCADSGACHDSRACDEYIGHSSHARHGIARALGEVPLASDADRDSRGGHSPAPERSVVASSWAFMPPSGRMIDALA